MTLMTHNRGDGADTDKNEHVHHTTPTPHTQNAYKNLQKHKILQQKTSVKIIFIKILKKIVKKKYNFK